MKALFSVLATAVIVGVISAASNGIMAAPITYDFTGAVLGNQALGTSHTYTAAGGPDITAISGSYTQLGLVRKLPNRPLIELDMGSQPDSDTICCRGDRYRTHQRAVFGG